MPKGVAKGRKLIAVPTELIMELNEQANRVGVGFHQYVAEVLEQAVRASQMKRSLREILDFYEAMEMRKASGHMLVPQDALRWLIKKLWTKEGDNLKDMWLNAGRWFGRFLATKFGAEAFDFFIKVLKASEWELGEVSLEEKGDIVRLRLASLTLPEEDTELLMYYVAGVMDSLRIKTENKEHTKGIIILKLRKNHR
jgi:hypothetical protein